MHPSDHLIGAAVIPNRLSQCALALVIGAVCLAPSAPLSPPPVTRDLDTLSPQQLNAFLEADLDDIYEGHSRTELVDMDELKSEIMDALEDSDDDGLESEIDEADLEAEMAEANTSLSNVIDYALSRIDRAEGPQKNATPLFYANFSGRSAPVVFRSTRVLAVQASKSAITGTVRAVPRR